MHLERAEEKEKVCSGFRQAVRERRCWHEMIGEPTIADAILDRIIHNAHRIALEGESMRRKKATRPLTESENTETNPD